MTNQKVILDPQFVGKEESLLGTRYESSLLKGIFSGDKDGSKI